MVLEISILFLLADGVTEEVSITTRRGHGAFFTPLPEWVEPLKSWIAKTSR